MNTEIITDYSDRINPVKRAERIAIIQSAGQDWQESTAATREGADKFVEAANKMRSAGEKLNQSSGHEQLIFSTNGVDFVRRDVLPHLPEKMDIYQCEYAVSMARILKQPAKCFEDLTAPAIQLLLYSVELEKRKNRQGTIGEGVSTPSNVLVSTMQSAKENFDKWLQWVKENPQDSIRIQSRQAVMAQLRWAHDTYEKMAANDLI